MCIDAIIWTVDFWSIHSADWWRRHWERTAIVEIAAADTMDEGWKWWLEWQRTVTPHNAAEIKPVDDDAGRTLGYIRVVGKRREGVKLEEYCWPDTLRDPATSRVHPKAPSSDGVSLSPRQIHDATCPIPIGRFAPEPDEEPRLIIRLSYPMSESLFPSGPWTGFYNYKPQDRHRMDLDLDFRDDRISGQGLDDVGRFTILGHYDTAASECDWLKTYPGSHSVYYRGYREGKGIWGRWDIGIHAHGGFHIWPRASEEEGATSNRSARPEPAMSETLSDTPQIVPAGLEGPPA